MRPAAVAAAAVLALAGCSQEGEEPQALAPVSASPSPSPTASLIPLPSPRFTGAQAEVERAMLAYFRAVNIAGTTGDLSAYRALHTPDCEACKNFVELFEDTAAKGQRFDGAQDEVLSYAIPPVTGDAAVADVRFRVTPYRILASDGSVVESFTPDVTRNIIAFNRIDGVWKVVGVTTREA